MIGPLMDGRGGTPCRPQARYHSPSSFFPSPRSQAPAWERTWARGSSLASVDADCTRYLLASFRSWSFEDNGIPKLELGNENENLNDLAEPLEVRCHEHSQTRFFAEVQYQLSSVEHLPVLASLNRCNRLWPCRVRYVQAHRFSLLDAA